MREMVGCLLHHATYLCGRRTSVSVVTIATMTTRLKRLQKIAQSTCIHGSMPVRLPASFAAKMRWDKSEELIHPPKTSV